MFGLACIRMTPDRAGLPRCGVTANNLTGLDPGDVNIIGNRTDGIGLAFAMRKENPGRNGRRIKTSIKTTKKAAESQQGQNA